jgi:hypothetical protein
MEQHLLRYGIVLNEEQKKILNILENNDIFTLNIDKRRLGTTTIFLLFTIFQRNNSLLVCRNSRHLDDIRTKLFELIRKLDMYVGSLRTKILTKNGFIKLGTQNNILNLGISHTYENILILDTTATDNIFTTVDIHQLRSSLSVNGNFIILNTIGDLNVLPTTINFNDDMPIKFLNQKKWIIK